MLVEERAETIERSEIVEVRTYPPCTRVCLTKSFPGGPWCMPNKRFYIMSMLKPHTYIGVCFAQWMNVFKFYCWLLKKLLFAIVYIRNFEVWGSTACDTYVFRSKRVQSSVRDASNDRGRNVAASRHLRVANLSVITVSLYPRSRSDGRWRTSKPFAVFFF